MNLKIKIKLNHRYLYFLYNKIILSQIRNKVLINYLILISKICYITIFKHTKFNSVSFSKQSIFF